MKILVSGSSGLIGSALTARLAAEGYGVARLVRGAVANEVDVAWNPVAGQIDAAKLAGLDAVVHLAGQSIAAGRWTAARKAAIRDSRVEGTRLLASSLARLASPPQVLVCASAIGFYGNRGDAELDESAPPGSGFLPEVCRQWEAAAEEARRAGIRTVHLRIAAVLSPRGGMLARILPLFRLGLGGRLGTGRQYFSWITLDDLLGAIRHVLETPALSGAVNAASPNPVTNAEFTKALGAVLRRPVFLPAPALALRAALGQMADELLLCSARVIPRRLLEAGFVFRDPALTPALSRLLQP